MKETLTIAVVGHTNTGKTSLMRTLTRKPDFGEVSLHPATTRHVEMADIAVEGYGHIRLFDTPGLEDSSGLFNHIEALKAKRQEDWLECLKAFVQEPSLQSTFTQEAKALGQVLSADVLFYVIDAREAVRAKYRDELELLGRCGKPVVPVLNFVASDEARLDAWRGALARVNMHAVAAFDTVVFDEAGEIALYKKIASLSEAQAPMLHAWVESLQKSRRDLRLASATIIAEMLVDVASARRLYPKDDVDQKAQTARGLKDAVRFRENKAVKDLLSLHRFEENSDLGDDLSVNAEGWSEDIFDPKALERFGLDAGKAMATGAAAGLAIDLMVGGITLGAAAMTGAVAGFVLDSARRYGSRVKEMVTGQAALRVDHAALRLITARETALLNALLKRGHGALNPVKRMPLDTDGLLEDLAPFFKELRATPAWSGLSDGVLRPPANKDRRDMIHKMSQCIDVYFCNKH